MPDTTTPATSAAAVEDQLADMLRHHELERFYTEEAAMLDDRRFDEWVTLFTDDAHYFMPIRRTRTRKELDKEFTQPGEVAFFDDNKALLESRVVKLATGRSWSEDPPSRTRHLITNVRITEGDASVEGGEMTVWTNFHLHRTRLVAEVDDFFGCRSDTLRRVDGELRIARRFIYLDQTVLTAPNLTVFF